ncbi:MAG: hypothetical protein ACOYO1_15550 [Bacteroidales bacterium]
MSRLKSNSYEAVYVLTTNAGHKSSDCGGGCRTINGIRYHADCQGWGSTCTLKATVSVSMIANSNKYIGHGLNDYEPIDEDTYNMPDRSFYVENANFENGHGWLNIPAQILQRDNNTHEFIYKDIVFTTEALYKNL